MRWVNTVKLLQYLCGWCLEVCAEDVSCWKMPLAGHEGKDGKARWQQDGEIKAVKKS